MDDDKPQKMGVVLIWRPRTCKIMIENLGGSSKSLPCIRGFDRYDSLSHSLSREKKTPFFPPASRNLLRTKGSFPRHRQCCTHFFSGKKSKKTLKMHQTKFANIRFDPSTSQNNGIPSDPGIRSQVLGRWRFVDFPRAHGWLFLQVFVTWIWSFPQGSIQKSNRFKHPFCDILLYFSWLRGILLFHGFLWILKITG